MARPRAGHFTMREPPLLLITTGAESSGKTTLARQLAEKLSAPLIEEHSRPYLEARYREQPEYQYGHDDLLRIADWHSAAEQAAVDRHPEAPYIVCDTDLLVLLVWEAVRFGQADGTLRERYRQDLRHRPRHYFLCHWDIPWEPDPLRENPHDRDGLYQRYIQALTDHDQPWTEVTGTRDRRLETAINTLQARL